MIGALKDKLGGITKLIPHIKGPMRVDAKLLTPNGEAIMRSLVDGFQRGIPMVEQALHGLTGGLPQMAGVPALAAARPRRGDPIDYERLADAVASRTSGTNEELLGEVRKLSTHVHRLPAELVNKRRKGL